MDYESKSLRRATNHRSHLIGLVAFSLLACSACIAASDGAPDDKGAPVGEPKADGSVCDYDWSDAGFECPASWIGTDDGCDCGCGVEDPDCEICPTLSPPAPDFCGDEAPVALYGDTGCVIGYGCATCPTLSPPAPGLCGDDDPEPVEDDAGCIIGYHCVSCPMLSPPAPDFCGDDSPRAIYDEAGCVTGYECPASCPEITPPAPELCGEDTPLPVYDEHGCLVRYSCPE